MKKETNRIAHALKEWIMRHEQCKRDEPYIKYADGRTKNLNQVLKDIEQENEEGNKFIDSVISVAITAIHSNKPKPVPTVRPMSELPEGARVLFKVEVDNSYIEYVTGDFIKNKETAYISLDNYNSVIPLVENPKRKRKLLGWLPLPEPNDIKL